jgi:hypothetical protein
MVWHLSIGHFMEELWMDEIYIYWTSSVDCACIGSPMTKCFMFSEWSLRGLQRGAFNCSLQQRIIVVRCVELEGWLFYMTILGFWTLSTLLRLEAGFQNDLVLVHRILFGWVIDEWSLKFSYFICGLYIHRLSNDHVFYGFGMPFKWPIGWVVLCGGL